MQAHNRKSDKYQDLVNAGEANGFDMALIPSEAGSQGFLTLHGFTTLLKSLSGPTRRANWDFLNNISRTANLGSHKIRTTLHSDFVTKPTYLVLCSTFTFLLVNPYVLEPE